MSTVIATGGKRRQLTLSAHSGTPWQRSGRHSHAWVYGVLGFAAVGAILASPPLVDALIGIATVYVVTSTLDRGYLTFRSFADKVIKPQAEHVHR